MIRADEAVSEVKGSEKVLKTWYMKPNDAPIIRADQRIKDWKAAIERYERSILDYTKAMEDEQKLKDAAVAEATSPERIAARMALFEVQWKNLSKHRAVERIRVTKDKVVITTKLLFTNVRTEAGVKTEVRRCIGAFDIAISFQNNTLEAKNLVFYWNSKFHWGISSGNVCLGDYQSDISRFFKAQDVLGILDTMLSMLRSTDDGSAYCRSHDFINNRQFVDKRFREADSTSPFNEGDYVVTVVNHAQGSSARLGSVARVVGIPGDLGGSYSSVEFKFKMGGHDLEGKAKPGYGWNVHISHIARISKAQYDSVAEGEVLKEAPNPEVRVKNKKTKTEILAVIDSLPEGTSIENVNNIEI